MTQRFINPLKMGLLGGFAAWASTLEKYNMMNAQNTAIEQRWKQKYGDQLEIQKSRNDALLKHFQAETEQRTSKVDGVQGDDGKLYSVTYRNMLQPDGQYVPKEVGRVPYQPKAAAGTGFNLSPGQTRYDAQGNPVASLPAKPDTTGEREDRIDKRTADRLSAAEAKADAQRKKDKEAQAEAATNSDMKEFNRGTDDQKAALLQEAGIDPSVFKSDDPNAVKPKYSAAAQYRATMLDQHKKELGVGDQPPAGDTGAAAPSSDTQSGGFTAPDGTFYPNGSMLQDANGKTRTVKDGKPVALAMDSMPEDVAETEQPPQDEEVADTAQPSGGIMEGNAPPDDEESEPTPDDESEEQPGIMNGRQFA